MSDIGFLTGTVDPQSGMVIQPDRRMVRFETVPTLNRVRSEAEGRPIYEPRTVLFVRHPGERDETAIEARPHHQYEFPRQWEAFQAGQKADPEGTPLAVLFPDAPHVVTHMRACHVFTVEMLAELTEEGLRRIGMGARDYQDRARKFMNAAAQAAPMHRVEAELRERDEKIAQLEAQVEMLAAATRRGRRKVEEGDDA